MLHQLLSIQYFTTICAYWSIVPLSTTAGSTKSFWHGIYQHQ